MRTGRANGASPRVAEAAPTRFRDVLRRRVFAVLFGAEMQSILGDQLARVALSVLVFNRTGSATATAATYAATVLPAVVGGPLVSRIGDRLSKRAVMIGVDTARCACVASMAIPGVPIGVMLALLIVSVAIGPVFSAAEISYLSIALPAEEFRLGTATRLMTSQAAQVLGFLLGGVIVATIGSRPTLLVDAATFALSVLAVATLFVRTRREKAELATAVNQAGQGGNEPAEASTPAEAVSLGRRAPKFEGLLRTPPLRALLLLGCLIGFFVVPEGLAVPFAHSAGASTAEIGVLLGAAALGGAIGAFVLGRLVRPTARRWVATRMAVLCGLPLAVPALHPSWPIAAACWCVSGVLAAYMIEVVTTLVQALPEQRRAHYVGIISALLLAVQGIGLLVFGALASVVAPVTAIAIAGVAGSALAITVVARRRPVEEHRAMHRARGTVPAAAAPPARSR